MRQMMWMIGMYYDFEHSRDSDVTNGFPSTSRFRGETGRLRPSQASGAYLTNHLSHLGELG